MKILALSDQVVHSIYSPDIRERYGDVDLVIGCGDLPYYYLEFITTMLSAPVVYVYGNHDKTQFTADGRTLNAAEGCRLIDGRCVVVNGLIVVGLGGSRRYQPNAINQYTEQEMWMRIMRLIPHLLYNRLRYGRFVDILVTHSPPYGIHDGTDLTHTGFKSLLTFMRYFRPRMMLHGHKHIYRRDARFKTRFHDTLVVNVYPSHLFEWGGDDEQQDRSPQRPRGI